MFRRRRIRFLIHSDDLAAILWALRKETSKEISTVTNGTESLFCDPW
jgi:hypothetical protein